VIKLPTMSWPPALVMKETVSVTLDFPEKRSDSAMLKDTLLNFSPMYPLLNASDWSKSPYEFSRNMLLEAVGAPNARPVTVITTCAPELASNGHWNWI
jgi:hypothetical protein